MLGGSKEDFQMSPEEVHDTLHHLRDVFASSALTPFYPIVLPVAESTAAHNLSSSSFAVEGFGNHAMPVRNTCFNLRHCCEGCFAVCLVSMRGRSWLTSLFLYASWWPLFSAGNIHNCSLLYRRKKSVPCSCSYCAVLIL